MKSIKSKYIIKEIIGFTNNKRTLQLAKKSHKLQKMLQIQKETYEIFQFSSSSMISMGSISKFIQNVGQKWKKTESKVRNDAICLSLSYFYHQKTVL